MCAFGEARNAGVLFIACVYTSCALGDFRFHTAVRSQGNSVLNILTIYTYTCICTLYNSDSSSFTSYTGV